MTSKHLFEWIDEVNVQKLPAYMSFLTNVLSYLSVYQSDSKTSSHALFHLTKKFISKTENLSNSKFKNHIFKNIKIITNRLSQFKGLII